MSIATKENMLEGIDPKGYLGVFDKVYDLLEKTEWSVESAYCTYCLKKGSIIKSFYTIEETYLYVISNINNVNP